MKNTCTLALALLIGFLSWSQNGINYKAIIKDASGNAISNSNITIRFSVMRTSVLIDYQESHTTTTDDNGLVIVTIGNGTPLVSTFDNLKWETYDYSLSIDIDTGSGLVNMGTTAFNNVPYAQSASSLKESPSRTLEVAGEGAQSLRINSKSIGRTSLEFLNTNSGDDWKFENTGLFLDIRVSDDNLATSEGKFTFRSDGRFGVNTISPKTELEVDGTIRSSDLIGSGLRNVLANSSGDLVIDTIPSKTIVIPGASFTSQQSSHFMRYYSSGTSAGKTSGTDPLYAPLIVPEGSTITDVTFHLLDFTSASNFNLECSVIKSFLHNTTPITEFSLSTFGGSGGTILNYSTPFLIDDRTRYVIRVKPTSFWSESLVISSVRVTYTE